MMKVQVYGDNLIDQADELVAEQVGALKEVMRRASRLLLATVRRRLSRVGAGRSSDPWTSPFRQSGELAGSLSLAPTTARANVVKGGIKSTLPWEHLNSVEYGWVRLAKDNLWAGAASRYRQRKAKRAVEVSGKGGKVAMPRPFLRPSEADVDAQMETLLDSVLGEGQAAR
jgi:hypothetical protein